MGKLGFRCSYLRPTLSLRQDARAYFENWANDAPQSASLGGMIVFPMKNTPVVARYDDDVITMMACTNSNSNMAKTSEYCGSSSHCDAIAT